MSSNAYPRAAEPAALLAQARRGDEHAFRALVDPSVPELHAHCYRMLGSVHDTEDVLQEVLLRAWRGIGRFEGRSELRSWLYRIATNVCLNTIARGRGRELPEEEPAAGAHVVPLWMEPYPDQVVGLGDGRTAPEARYEQREGVELAFVATLQHLSANQRAVLVLCEVLAFSAREVADMLDTTTAAVNSALQHARERVRRRLPDRSQQVTLREIGDHEVREVVLRYSEAMEQGDVAAMVTMLTADATWSMPPTPRWYRGREAIAAFLVSEPFTLRWRHRPARANGQPAIGWYLWDDRRGTYSAEVIEVLTLRGTQIAAVTAFIRGELFTRFGLPRELPGGAGPR